MIAIFAARMLAGEPITIFGDGNQTRDYVFIDDVVHAFVQAADRGPGKLVNVGTGLETSVNHLFRLLAGITGYELEPEFGPLPPGSSAVSPSTSGRRRTRSHGSLDPSRGRARRDGGVPQGRMTGGGVAPAVDAFWRAFADATGVEGLLRGLGVRR